MLKRSLLLCLLVAPAMAYQSGWLGNSSIEFKANYFDRYLFRGLQLSDEAVKQVGLGIGMGAWNYDLLHSELEYGSANFKQENAHVISVTTLSKAGVTTFGYQFLDYDGDRADTQELFARYTYNSNWNPVLSMDYDFDTYKGYHIDYTVERPFPMTRQSVVFFKLKADLAYDLQPKEDRAGQVIDPGFYSKNGLVHYQAGLKYVWSARRWFKLEAHYEYHWMKDDYLRAALDGRNHQSVAGASFRVTFP